MLRRAGERSAELQDVEGVLDTSYRAAWRELGVGAGSPAVAASRALGAFAGGQVMLATAWHQGAPYNRDCPQIFGSEACYSALVGCVPLAAAQIMRYWAWPPYGAGFPYRPTGELLGKLIVLEGSDGVGRSTQINMLRTWLEAEGYAVSDTGLRRSNLTQPGLDAAKALLAGATVVQTASAVIKNGLPYVSTMLRQLEEWMTEKGYLDKTLTYEDLVLITP